MTHELRKKLREVAKLATPGLWTTDYEKDGCLIDSSGTRIALTNDRDFASFDVPLEECRNNAELIVTLKNNITTLLDLLDRYEAALDKIPDACDCGYGCASSAGEIAREARGLK